MVSRIRPTAICAATLALISAALSEGPARADATADLIRRGDQLYARRFSDKVTWEAIGFYRQARSLQPQSYEASWKLARAFFWLADSTDDKEKDRALGGEGYQHAQHAVRLQPSGVEGHFYSAMCLGEHAKSMSVVKALRSSARSKILAALDAVLRIDRRFDGCGADRAYGVYYHRLPWPLRDVQKALGHLQRAAACDGGRPRTRFYLAQVLLAEKRRDEARQQIQLCLQVAPTPDPPEYVRYQWHCRQLAARLGE